MDNHKWKIIELNVGGCRYTTTLGTLTNDQSTLLAEYFTSSSRSIQGEVFPNGSSPHSITPVSIISIPPLQQQPITDPIPIQRLPNGTYFIDRDGDLFRYILDYLRNNKLLLPDNYQHIARLREEAKFYRINELVKSLKPGAFSRRETMNGAILPALVNGAQIQGGRNANESQVIDYGYMTIAYRGTFAFGRDGQADVKFRKLSRILICGKASLCREVFGDTLNESRDPDRGGENRYTARLYLKHSSLELAFDMLTERGFELITSCASGTCASGDLMRGSAADSEEQKWNHYNEFVFYRSPKESMV